MNIRSVRESSFEDLKARAGALIVACGYEHRSQGVTRIMEDLPQVRQALCFRDHSRDIARPENEQFFEERRFRLHTVGTEETKAIRALVHEALLDAVKKNRAVAFDISTMTRSWHGAIVSELRNANLDVTVETFFAYAPSVYMPPSPFGNANEFVSPVTGFASLSTPDRPVAAIIGLGYDKEGALGLQQLLDPALTVLLVPNGGDGDQYHPVVLRNNKLILERTPAEWTFDYSFSQPASTFGMLASIIGGIRGSYRIVLASLGPKMFGLICFLLATKFSDVSVWRVSSGMHAKPRDSQADLKRTVVLDVVWEP